MYGSEPSGLPTPTSITVLTVLLSPYPLLIVFFCLCYKCVFSHMHALFPLKLITHIVRL